MVPWAPPENPLKHGVVGRTVGATAVETCRGLLITVDESLLLLPFPTPFPEAVAVEFPELLSD
jgi:hypothetical protein